VEGEHHDRARSYLRQVLSIYHHHHHRRAHLSPASCPSLRDSEEDYPHKCPGRLRRGADTRSTSSVLHRTLMLMPRLTPRRMSGWKTGGWESGAGANCEDRGRRSLTGVKMGWAGCRLYQTSTKSRNVSVNSERRFVAITGPALGITSTPFLCRTLTPPRPVQQLIHRRTRCPAVSVPIPIPIANTSSFSRPGSLPLPLPRSRPRSRSRP
jgi:hypothetical protein